ncbi:MULTISPECIES: hypothetical protein [unclassified Parvimonas]|uniref:hypothetical protein n=1 Tax=unclassified Parvimonas TaxID=1151464 RepID=UPI002B4778A0|nr:MULTISPECIES: hypothetical protein [unclassified Parvimonas]MEB3025097.1 hypothetical protein [Parvimonas sp. M13]MEB3089247.1 hypothetical protein [Parvimonas sp. M20]
MNIFYSVFSSTAFWGDVTFTIPLWILWVLPILWPFIIPMLLVFYSTVLYIFMLCLKVEIPLKKIIVRVTFFGFLCDIIAIILMFLIVGTLEIFIKPTLGFFNWYGSFLYSLVVKIPMNIVEVLILGVAILLSRIINYKLNKRYTFSKLDIEEEKKKKLALAIAIFTAPYMFFFTITI